MKLKGHVFEFYFENLIWQKYFKCKKCRSQITFCVGKETKTRFLFFKNPSNVFWDRAISSCEEVLMDQALS